MKNRLRERARVRARARKINGFLPSGPLDFLKFLCKKMFRDLINSPMQNFLSEAERNTLKTQHRMERDKRVCDRIKAVLLYDKGWNFKKIAEVLLLSDVTVGQHIQDYQASQKLKPENGGSVSKLDDQQTKSLLEHLQKHTYLYTKDIIAYVQATFGLLYTVPGMTSWLKIHGFSYKKPAVVPGKANREAQEQWIKEYIELKNTSLAQKSKCTFYHLIALI